MVGNIVAIVLLGLLLLVGLGLVLVVVVVVGGALLEVISRGRGRRPPRAIDGSSWRGSAAVTGDAVGAAATLTASPSSSTRSLPRPSGGPDLQSTARVRSGATRWGDPARPDAAPQGVR